MSKIASQDAVILAGIRFLRGLVRICPASVSLFVGRRIGTIVYYFSKRSRIAYKNLRCAFATEKSSRQLRRIARHSIENLAACGVDLLRIPEMDLKHVRKHIRVIGQERFEPFLKEKKGIIFLTAHFGSWEVMNIAGSLMGYPMVVLARIQKHPRSDVYLNSLRTSKGSQVIYKGMPIRDIMRSLKEGKIVGILSDQDGGRGGTFVPFFGRSSSTPPGAAAFSLRTGSPLFPVFIFREGVLDHRVEVEGPLTFPDPSLSKEASEAFLLKQFAEILEQKIRKAPEQWLWAHRRWKSTPDRFVLVLSDGKAGHTHQSRALLEAFKEERASGGFGSETVHEKTIEVRFRHSFLRKWLKFIVWLTRGRMPFGMGLLKLVLTPETYRSIQTSYADVVISCGSWVEGVNLVAARENVAKSAVLMKPIAPIQRFTAVVIPKHDHPKRADNVFVTRGAPSWMTRAFIARESERLSGELGLSPAHKRVGILIGGDTEKIKFEEALFAQALDSVARAGGEPVFLITTSRRTPGWAEAALKKTFIDHPRCASLVIANEKNKEGIVPGILGLSDVLVVTGESISMVSEAASTGKPVLVFTPSREATLKPKYRSFLEGLERDRRIARISAADLGAEVGERLRRLSLGFSNGAPFGDESQLRHAAQRLI